MTVSWRWIVILDGEFIWIICIIIHIWVIIVGGKCAINIYKMCKHLVKFAYFVLYFVMIDSICAQHVSKFCWSSIITILLLFSFSSKIKIWFGQSLLSSSRIKIGLYSWHQIDNKLTSCITAYSFHKMVIIDGQ